MGAEPLPLVMKSEGGRAGWGGWAPEDVAGDCEVLSLWELASLLGKGMAFSACQAGRATGTGMPCPPPAFVLRLALPDTLVGKNCPIFPPRIREDSKPWHLTLSM